MDSGKDMSEVKDETAQPNEALAGGLEETTAPTVDTEQAEFYIEEEGDQQQTPKTNMSQEQAYAAFKEEKRKRKDKQKKLDEAAEQKNAMSKQIADLQKQVSGMTKGKPPTMESCDYDEVKYQAAMQEYYAKPKAQPKADDEPVKQEQAFQLSDDQEFALHQSELKLKKSFKDYDDAKGNVTQIFDDAGINGALVVEQLAAYSHSYGVDAGKAIYALNRNPGIAQELIANGNNPQQIGAILKKLESKIKVRETKDIKSKPEPEINSSGPVDVLNEQVNQARKAYQKTPSTKNFKALAAAKKKVKENG